MLLRLELRLANRNAGPRGAGGVIGFMLRDQAADWKLEASQMKNHDR